MKEWNCVWNDRWHRGN